MNRGAMWSLVRSALSMLAPALLLASCAQEPAEPPPLEGARIGGPFTLTGEDGKSVSWSDFDGQYRIVYFGFTFCPDACPMDVQTMMRGFSEFEDEHPELARKVQPLFISIDPERDTPPVLTEFTDAFHPRLLGLSGTDEQTAQVTKDFAAYYKRLEGTPDGGYLMDHSRQAYLMGSQGEPLALLPVDRSPEAVATELAKWVT